MAADEIRLTLNDVMSWSPCVEYSAERIREMFSGRESVGMDEIVEEILQLPKHDVLWFLLREPFIREDELMLLASIYVHHACLSASEASQIDLLCSDALHALDLALMASDGDFTKEHFMGFNNPDLENWTNHMSDGTRAAMLSALWSTRIVGAQVVHQNLNRMYYVGRERSFQVDELLKFIGRQDMRRQANG